ncbi:peptidoglycan-binding domain-containing protein [Flavobacterium sp. GCM10027622]|uniref:peptidoglycan-binding domain-containing protein n=1 Tax=unclassified Flavobacterium TaxID=196869 RepID=UPI00360EAD12
MGFLQNLDNEDKLLIGVGLLSAGLLGILWWRKKKAEQEVSQLPIEEPSETTSIPKVATPPISKPKPQNTLNRSLPLKNGSRGNEVQELQRKLGVEADGIFGSKTETALLKAKGVKSITLNQFDGKTSLPIKQAAKVVTTIKIPKPGQKLMAIKDDFNIFKAAQNADGTYTNTGASGTFSTFNYGEEVGIFKVARNNGQYLIEREGKLYFVTGTNVKAY